MKAATIITAAIASSALYFYFRKVRAKNKTVVIVGDSLSLYPGGWQSILDGKYNWNVINLARVGNVTANMVGDYSNFTGNHDFVIVYGGANDIGAGLNYKFPLENINTIIELAKKRGKRVIVVTGYRPVNDTVFQKKYGYFKNRLSSLPGIVVPAITATSVKDNVHMTSEEDHQKLANIINLWALRK